MHHRNLIYDLVQSEEDIAIKAELDLLAERIQDKDLGVQKLALETLRSACFPAEGNFALVSKYPLRRQAITMSAASGIRSVLPQAP